jgi:hypothetical protein
MLLFCGRKLQLRSAIVRLQTFYAAAAVTTLSVQLRPFKGCATDNSELILGPNIIAAAADNQRLWRRSPTVIVRSRYL